MSNFPKRMYDGILSAIADLKQQIQNITIPQGTIWWFHGRTTAPKGWAICDGTNGTPNLIDKYPLGATSDIGSTVNAGLPNVTGSFDTFWRHDSGKVTTSGAFSDNGNAKAVHIAYTYGGLVKSRRVAFSAYDSDPIYGNSTTVTPPSVKLLPCMKL